MRSQTQNIKAVIFDWGGVLIDNPTEDLMRFCAEALSITPNELKNAFSVYADSFQTGAISEKNLWKNISSELKIPEPESPSLWKDAVRAVFREKTEVFELVRKLKDCGCKTGFLSNTEIPAMEYFFEKDYGKHFDSVTFSCAEGVAKPDTAIYLKAAVKLGVKPGEAIFIDDKPEYIDGAVKAGLKGIVFKDCGQLVSSLNEVFRI
jgi:putative hydrolase of the HAD superfamily